MIEANWSLYTDKSFIGRFLDEEEDYKGYLTKRDEDAAWKKASTWIARATEKVMKGTHVLMVRQDGSSQEAVALEDASQKYQDAWFFAVETLSRTAEVKAREEASKSDYETLLAAKEKFTKQAPAGTTVSIKYRFYNKHEWTQKLLGFKFSKTYDADSKSMILVKK